MKRVIITIGLLIVILNSLSGFTRYDVFFTAFEPSSINLALGEPTGVVNIWHNNPLTFYSNPAIAALHEGFSWGYYNQSWDLFFYDIHFTSSLVSFGYKGMSITLPSLNRSLKFGTTMDYGTQDRTDEYGQYLGEFRSWENAAVFGIAANLPEVWRNYGDANPIFDHIDFSVGINGIRIVSDLAPAGTGQTETGAKGKGTAFSFNFGAIVAANYNWDNYILRLLTNPIF